MVSSSLVWGEIRRRWRGAAAIGLVLGIGFAAVLTAAAGARRTQTAFPRMLSETGGTQVLVGSADPDPLARRRFYERVGGLAGVDQIGILAGIQMIPVHVPRGAGTELTSCSSLSVDGVFGYELDRPNVLQGRLPRPDRSDEILVTKGYADSFGVGVGDRLDLVLPGLGDNPAIGEATAADGPVVPATIVGIGSLATQIVPVSDLDAAPTLLAPPALGQRYKSDPGSWCFDGAVLSLEPGADVGAVMTAIDQIEGSDGGSFVQDRTTNHADVRRAIQPQVTTLWLFASVAAVATLLVAAQLLGRQLRQAAVTSMPVWRALGLTRRQARVLVAAPSLVTALVGAGLASAGAVALSSRFPIGPARLAETDRGMELHSGIHLGGSAVVVGAATAIGLFGFMVGGAGTRPGRAGWLSRAARGSSQPAVMLGAHLAAGTRRDEAAVPVRSAIAGAALSVAAVVATLTFASGLDSLVSDPARYGRDWDVMVDGAFAPAPVAQVLRDLGPKPSVAAIAGGRYGELAVDGKTVPAIGLVDLQGTTFPTITDGRAPITDEEMVVGKVSLREMGRSIGDSVVVDPGTGPRTMTIVGTAPFPRLNHGSFSTLGLGIGAAVRSRVLPPFDLDVSDPPPDLETGDYTGPDGQMFEFVTIRTRPGATPEARREVLVAAMEIADARGQALRTQQRPIAIDNYAAVRSAPTALALLLGMMAAATLAHLVVSVVRRRRRDLAVCIALGMQRQQVLRAVVLQALLVATMALLVGVPLGLAAGRLAWRRFAADLGVIETLRLPWSPLFLLVISAEAAAIMVAVVPAMAASRTRPAQVLRAE